MSTVVDSRVAELRFDNSHFEKNVATSMSTLDKLKQKLNLKGASKGLEDVSKAANSVDFSKAEITATRAGFHIQDVWLKVASVFEYQIARRITNAATNMFNSLMVAPIKDGWNEYEMTLNSVQTTMAATGKTSEEVEKELKKLDEYADKTVYSTADMLSNLPKFTNAGVDLEVATKAMIGIANATAHAGGDASKASIAFYNLGQAIGTGYLTRMDYNSINNAGIATMEWKKQMVEAAIAQGTLTQVGEDAYQAGNKTLTLQQLFIDGLQEQWATMDVMLEVFGAYGDETTEIGQAAYSSAQDIKTFTMMMDSLKATAGTGWKDTWQIVFGGLEEAKEFWTGLTNFISGIIEKMADVRNTILETALAKNFKYMLDDIKKVFDLLNPVKEAINDVTSALVDYDKLADEIIAGKWKNAPTRWEDLAAAGYDWAHAQNLVNERLGCSVRHATNFSESADKATESTQEASEATGELTEEQKKLLKELFKMSDAQLEAEGYTQDQIKAIRALQEEIEKVAKKLGISVDFFLDNMDKINGRWLLINSFKTIGQSLITIFKSIGEAWNDAFGITAEEAGNKLFDFIAAFHRFSQHLKIGDETADNLTRTLKGVFAILDLMVMVVGGPIKIAFKIITKLLGMFNLNILDVTAAIGDVIVKFRDWVEDNNIVMDCLYKLVNIIKNVVLAIWELEPVQDAFKAIKKTVSDTTKSIKDSCGKWLDLLADLAEGTRNGSISFREALATFGTAVKDAFMSIPLVKTISKWIKAFWELPEVQKYVEQFSGVLGKFKNKVSETFGGVSGIGEWFSNAKKAFSDAISMGRDIVAGLQKGLKDGTITIKDAIVKLANFLITSFKNVLQIESPSKVFIAIGGFIIAGLLAGLMNGSGDVEGFFSGLGDSISGILSNIPWGNIFAAAISIGSVIAVNKFADFLGALGAPLQGVGDLLSGVGDVLSKSARQIKKVIKNTAKVLKSTSKVLNGFAWNLKAKALQTVAVSIAILVGAIILLTFIDPGKLWGAIGAIAALAVILGGLTVAIGKFGPESSGDFAKVALSLMGMASAVLILGIALKIMSSISPEGMEQALWALGNVVIGLITIMTAFTALSQFNKNVDKVGSMLLSMAGALLIMAIVVKILGKLKPEVVKQGELAILGLVGLMALMMLITKIGNAKKVGGMLSAMAGAIAILAGVVILLGGMSVESIIKGELAIAGLVGIMALLMLVSRIANFKKVGGMLAAMAGAIALLGLTVAILGHMSVESIIKGELAIAGLVGIMTLMMYAVKKFGKSVDKIGTTILALSGAIAVLAITAIILGLIPVENLAKGIIAVGLLAVIAGLLIKSVQGVDQCKGELIALTVMIGVLALAVGLLSFVDTGKLAAATLAIAAVLGMLTLVIKQTKGINGSMGVLIALTVCIGLLSTALYLLARLPVEQTLGAALSLSLLMGVLTGVLMLFSKIKVSLSNALYGIVGLLALCVPLVSIAGILCMMSNAKNAIENAQALTLLATALSLLLLPLSLVGFIYAATGGLAALGLLGLLGMCVPLLAIAGILSMMSNTKNAMANATALTMLISTLGDVCFKLALVGPLALIGVAALTGLTALIVGIGALAVGIGALVDKFPALQTFLDKGIPILVQMAGGLGEMIGAFIGGIATGIMSVLPGIGLALGQFMINATPFIAGAKMVDEKVLAGVGILAGAILALTAADLIEGVVSFLNGGSSFATLGTELSNFMLNALPFITMANMIKPECLDGVKSLAEAILILTGANLVEGLVKFFGGESSLGSFGAQLGQLGTDLNLFVTNLGTFTEDQVTTVTCAGNAIKALAQAASEIPNEGGWAAKILGENSLASFGEALPALGLQLRMFIMNLGTFGEDQIASVECAGKAISALANAAKEIPNEGGWAAKILGDNSLASFGEALPALGLQLRMFIMNLGTFGDDSIATVDCAGKAIKSLADAATKIPNEGGFWSKIVGENSLATFSSKLPGLATNIAGFVSNLGTFGEAQIATVNSAVKVIEAIAGLGEIDLSTTSSGLGSLGGQLTGLATNISSFVSKLSGVGSDSISSAVEKTKELINLAKTAAETNVDSLSTFGKSLKKVATDGVSGFVKEFTKDSPKKQVETNAKALAKAASTAAGSDSIIKKFKSAGKDCATGFANGIKNNKSLASDAGTALGKAALKAAKKALDENSPSKEMYKVGAFAGEGFVNALWDYESKSYDSAYGVAEYAKRGLSKAVAKINDLFNSDIDTQPTIRPVLDLSEVTAGAGTINGLFSNPSVGVMANVNSISSMMSNRQNGGTDDVVSAINKLRKDLGNVGGTTNNINGINIGDDTNINDAVNVLVRAARMGGRS